MSNKAYNLTVTPLSIEDGVNANGTRKIKATVTFVRGDKTIQRTMLFQGKAANDFADELEVGKTAKVRALFCHMPKLDDEGNVIENARGAEYLTVVGRPMLKAA